MKRFIAFLLIFGTCMSACAFAAFSSAISGKTTVGINYLTWGTFTGITAETNSITSGLTAIRAYGVTINTAEAFASDGSSEVYAFSTSTGVIRVKSAVSTARGGKWWAIGR